MNLFSPSSLVVCEKLHQNQLIFYFQLLALSKIKPTRYKYFHIFLILLSGDVCLNPGPIKHPCSSYLKPVVRTHKSILCDECGLWAHIKCERISDKQYRKLMSTPEDKLFFTCSPCLAQNLPFAGEEVPDNEIPDNVNEISFDDS